MVDIVRRRAKESQDREASTVRYSASARVRRGRTRPERRWSTDKTSLGPDDEPREAKAAAPRNVRKKAPCSWRRYPCVDARRGPRAPLLPLPPLPQPPLAEAGWRRGAGGPPWAAEPHSPAPAPASPAGESGPRDRTFARRHPLGRRDPGGGGAPLPCCHLPPLGYFISARARHLAPLFPPLFPPSHSLPTTTFPIARPARRTRRAPIKHQLRSGPPTCAPLSPPQSPVLHAPEKSNHPTLVRCEP